MIDLATYCTRCRREDTDARDIYYPLSDEYIQLCTSCEPDDTAVSPFELWHRQPTDQEIEEMLDDCWRTELEQDAEIARAFSHQHDTDTPQYHP